MVNEIKNVDLIDEISERIREIDRQLGEYYGEHSDLTKDSYNFESRQLRKINKLTDPIWNKYKNNKKVKFKAYPNVMMDGTPYVQYDRTLDGILNKDKIFTEYELETLEKANNLLKEARKERDDKYGKRIRELQDLAENLEKERKNLRTKKLKLLKKKDKE